MDAAKKYTFGQSFINADGHYIVPEVENARETGYQAGYDEGYVTAKNELEADLLAMMTVLNMRMAEVSDRQKEAYQFVTSSTVNLVKAIVQRVVPHVIAKHGDEEVLGFVDEVLKGLKSTSEIKISVNPALNKAVEARVQEHLAEHEGQLKIIVKPDDAIEKTDCMVTWDDGGVEHIKTKLLQSVDQALNRVLGNVPIEKEEVTTGENDV